MHVDLFLKNATYFCSGLKRFLHGNLAIIDDTFFYIGERDDQDFDAKEVIDVSGKYVVPGLVDIHLHIESTMITPQNFSAAVLKNGVTTIVADPHEMANVFGVEGIREMIEAGKNSVVDILTGISSSVPSTPFETTGGTIDIEDIDELMRRYADEIVCLGEVMDYMNVIHNPQSKMSKIVRHVKETYPDLDVEGHFPKLVDLDLAKFVYAGVDSDHTHQTIGGFEARVKAGMFVEIQEKSMTPELINHLIEHDRSEHFCFITDDVMPDTLVEKGHLNHLLRKAVQMGMSPEAAIYACTYTPSKRMKLNDRGCIAPRKLADFCILSDLQQFTIEQVYKNGKCVYDAQTESNHEDTYVFPTHFYSSVKLNPLSPDDFRIQAPIDNGEINCRVIMVQDGFTFTEEKIASIPVQNGILQLHQTPYLLIGVFERYGKTKNRTLALIGGDIIKQGAVATTYAHDHHNLLVVGKNPVDMALAANDVIRNQGGYTTALDGNILTSLRLDIGGILSREPLNQVAAKVKDLRASMHELGYKHYNPIMSLSTLSLPVSPAIKITDQGLIDVNNSSIIDVFV